MNCRQVESHLLDLAAGQPAGAELEQHLAACSGCAAHLRELRQTMALLDEWTAPEDTSPYFYTRLRARVREEAASPASWLAWLRKPALAFSLASLMVASIALVRGGRDLNRTPAAHVARVADGPGSAVGDLQYLDKNHELLADFDMLDDLDGGR